MADKIKFKINVDKFPDLLSKIEDLTKIDDSVKLKIDSDNIFMYSLVGDSAILAFKNYIVPTSDYFGFSGSGIDITLDLIVPSAKKLVRNLSFIKGDKIGVDVSYKLSDDGDVGLSRSVLIDGGKLKIKVEPGEPSTVRDISKSQLKSRLDLKNRKWSFKIDRSDFNDIKRLASINSEGKIIHLNLTDGKVILSESSSWELEVGESDYKNNSLVFNKNFLSSINDGSGSVEFNVFETFMLIKDDSSNLMISFETDFSD